VDVDGGGLESMWLERGPRGRIAAKVVHDRIELELPLARKEFAA
jgi:hypothetical protein